MSRSQLAPALVPPGKILTRCALFTALGPSRRHMPGNPTPSMGRRAPMQPVRLPSDRLPVTAVAFSVRLSCETKSAALASAWSHSIVGVGGLATDRGSQAGSDIPLAVGIW